MSERKISEGPWEYGEDMYPGSGVYLVTNDTSVICEVRSRNPEEDAAAISELPNLIAALTYLVNACDYTDGRSGRLVMLPKALEQARAALLRAQASEQSGG